MNFVCLLFAKIGASMTMGREITNFVSMMFARICNSITMERINKGALAIRRIFSLVDMITKP